MLSQKINPTKIQKEQTDCHIEIWSENQENWIYSDKYGQTKRPTFPKGYLHKSVVSTIIKYSTRTSESNSWVWKKKIRVY
jgi:hypothetical protein